MHAAGIGPDPSDTHGGHFPYQDLGPDQAHELYEILRRHTRAESGWFLLWDGDYHGGLVLPESSKVHDGFDMSWYAFRGPLWAWRGFWMPPRWWWPDDRAWCYQTSIDSDLTNCAFFGASRVRGGDPRQPTHRSGDRLCRRPAPGQNTLKGLGPTPPKVESDGRREDAIHTHCLRGEILAAPTALKTMNTSTTSSARSLQVAAGSRPIQVGRRLRSAATIRHATAIRDPGSRRKAHPTSLRLAGGDCPRLRHPPRL